VGLNPVLPLLLGQLRLLREVQCAAPDRSATMGTLPPGPAGHADEACMNFCVNVTDRSVASHFSRQHPTAVSVVSISTTFSKAEILNLLVCASESLVLLDRGLYRVHNVIESDLASYSLGTNIRAMSTLVFYAGLQHQHVRHSPTSYHCKHKSRPECSWRRKQRGEVKYTNAICRRCETRRSARVRLTNCLQWAPLGISYVAFGSKHWCRSVACSRGVIAPAY
jgi:hypothetical protein